MAGKSRSSGDRKSAVKHESNAEVKVVLREKHKGAGERRKGREEQEKGAGEVDGALALRTQAGAEAEPTKIGRVPAIVTKIDERGLEYLSL